MTSPGLAVRGDNKTPEKGLDQNWNPVRHHQRSFKAETLAEDGQHLSVVQRFYSGASVFVTGATGFMGKVLIEKLLRSCPDIEMVYIMVREKKGKSMEERVKDIITSPCFDRIKEEFPGFQSKIRGVPGDVSLEGLGINEEDRILLREQVDIVFHMAATVRFDEHLKLAILQNVRGTREVLNLCKTFNRLKSVVHVSTAYSNCPREYIEEKLYPSPLDSNHAIRLAETHDVTTVDRLSHKLVGDWPNTYSFTKAISEDTVRLHGQGLPVSIFRPSVVICTRAEPLPGWIDNLYGPTGCLVACAGGLLRTMHIIGSVEANIVPCDMAINALVVSALDTVENRESCDVPVYNYVCPSYNPITWQRYLDLFKKYGHDYPPSKSLYYSTFVMFSNRLVYLLVRFFIHILPALFMDIGFLASGRKPQMLKVYNKVHRFTNVISYFATRHWDFDLGRVEGMWRRVFGKDRELFFFSMDGLDWERFVSNTCPGLRTGLFKDPVETLPQARVRWRRFYILHCTMKGLAGFCVFWTLHLSVPLFTAGLQLLKDGLVAVVVDLM